MRFRVQGFRFRACPNPNCGWLQMLASLFVERGGEVFPHDIGRYPKRSALGPEPKERQLLVRAWGVSLGSRILGPFDDIEELERSISNPGPLIASVVQVLSAP